MRTWRDIKRQGRRDRHAHMSVAAIYIAQTGASPVRVNVRDHTRSKTTDVSGVGEGFAQMLDTEDRLIFDRSEVSVPLRNGLVFMGSTEAYRVNQCRPPDDMEITAEVTILSESEAGALWQEAWSELLA